MGDRVVRRGLLTVVDPADDAVVGGADGVGMERPRRMVFGRGRCRRCAGVVGLVMVVWSVAAVFG